MVLVSKWCSFKRDGVDTFQSRKPKELSFMTFEIRYDENIHVKSSSLQEVMISFVSTGRNDQ